MKMLLDAIKFAHQKHDGQLRRGSGDVYITHPLAVSYILAAFKRSKRLVELLVVALLHDCLEDSDATYEEIKNRFSKFVADLVLELSNDEEEMARVGKLEYHTRKLMVMTSYGLLIKLADRLHNVSDHPTPKMLRDTLELMARISAGRKLSKTHKALIAEIIRICNEAQIGVSRVSECFTAPAVTAN